ncbi:hypothetical protein ACNOYE_15475 [Nannocystaceae bacterium ST9]
MLPRNRTALAELLARTFPSSAGQLDAQTIDAFVDALMAVKTRRGEAKPIGPDPCGPGEHVVYRLRATHARRLPIVSVFTGETEAVRVTLGEHAPITWDTPIGLVIPEDHLLPTVDALREKFGARLDRPFEHVELITPARYAFTRFAPMAIYLGYEHAGDARPFFYVFEAGTATGQPKVLYLAPTLDAIVEERSGYEPTPLSSADHWYSGGLRFAAGGNDPEVLFMRASKQRGGEPHLRLHVEYVIHEGEPSLVPAEDMVEAAMRMLAVQRGLALDQNLVEKLIGEAGLSLLGWVDRPDDAGKHLHHAQERVRHTLHADAQIQALDEFAAGLSEPERALLHASMPALLGLVVRADGKFDRLERIEVDWVMNFEVPAQLGDAFRFSPAAERAYAALVDERPHAELDHAWLEPLGRVVERMPTALRQHYREFVASICRSAAESSGELLWFGAKVNAKEHAMLDRIAAALGLAG